MEIKSFNPAVLLEWLPDGHLEGNEFVALNPNREDRTKGSFKINVWNTFWADHAIENAAGRGASSLIAYLFPIVTKWSMATGRLKPWQPPRDDPANAGVKWLEGDYAPPMADIFRVAEEALLSPPPEGWLPPQGSSSRSRSRDRSKLVTPVPFLADLNAYLYRDWRLGKPSKFWPYHNEAGELLGFQMRFDLDDGRKEIRPLTYWGEEGWVCAGLPVPRPLYRLHEIARRRKAIIVVAEGEKTADAAQRLFPHAVATTPQNGAKAPKRTDWSIVRDRILVVFTDHDDEGDKFGQRVRSLALAAGATQVRIVRSEDVARLMDRQDSLPEKWDLADAEQEGLDATRAAALLEFTPIEGGYGDVREPSQNGVDCAQLAGLPHSAKGLADRFTARFQHRAAWVDGAWRVFDGKRWAEATDTSARVLAAEAIELLSEEADFLAADPAKQEELFKLQKRARSSSNAITSVLKEAAADCQRRPETFDGPGALNLFNASNGTIDLRTGVLSQHEPADFLQRLTPIAYDPSAKSDLWERVLLDCLRGDHQQASAFQRAVGYALTGEQSAKAAFFILGNEDSAGTNGDNGKSLVLSILKSVFGEYAVTTDSNLIEQTRFKNGGGAATPQIARLQGVRFVKASEFDRGSVADEALLKNLTGNEEITGRHLYAGYDDFTPQFALWFATNYLPFVKSKDAAITSRIVTFPFYERFYRSDAPMPAGGKRMDETLKARLTTPEALQGVLAWAVRGAIAWYRDGLQLPKSMLEVRDQRLRAFDAYADFIETYFVSDADGLIQSSDIEKLWFQWTGTMRFRDEGEKRAFFRDMGDRGLAVHDKKIGGKAWRKGMRLSGTAERALGRPSSSATVHQLPQVVSPPGLAASAGP